MSDRPKHSTLPQDKVPFFTKVSYGTGALANTLLGAAIGMMSIVLVTGLKMNPAVVGMLMALPRLVDAFTDPMMGYISDRTQSRWGRRRPYIFCGAILMGLIFAGLWQLPAGSSESFYFWYFLVGSIVFYAAYTVFATPWVALGYELTPDYNERTRLLGTANFMGNSVWLVLPWFYAFMENDALFTDAAEGARFLAIGVGVFVAAVGIVPALFCRERMDSVAAQAETADQVPGLVATISRFFSGLREALKCGPFVKLCLATLLVFGGYMLVSSFTSFVIIYYIFEGDQDLGGKYMGLFGTVSAVSNFGVIAFSTWLSTKIGKRKMFFLAVGLSLVGYGSKWFLFQPEHPKLLLLSAPLIAFGVGALFTLIGSMIADVCDLDELKTGERREGMFGSVYWWMVKLGLSLAFFLGGYLLNATGFDVELGGNQMESALLMMRIYDIGIPIATSAIAIAIVASYSITEARSLEIRKELEHRRGHI